MFVSFKIVLKVGRSLGLMHGREYSGSFLINFFNYFFVFYTFCENCG